MRETIDKDLRVILGLAPKAEAMAAASTDVEVGMAVAARKGK